ncbi:SDR family oxidoreductase [Kitasatospora viridis]|uniref:NAD(P)-dependent dehydrogenase (Short-subunit alcohol dehydrogenase family) n=1 Tax=Kitasatospora viridis TaxID=281105 RepID=A0A561UGX4_9ACTN|nr:SDR family oxidoreductase [Kitasatospora viridis]TWF98612.1 NAD(P)-dependent dehydrogenase (short-subunit alcohol dehydrogenase family) [Kitasatospora viridis]
MSERIVIIGGTAGIGLAAAKHFEKDGHRVVIAGRDAQRLAAALEQLGSTAEGRTVDAGSPESLAELFAAVGEFDHLVVTVAPHGGAGPVADLQREQLRALTDGKLAAHLLAVQAALPTLRADGSITLVGAVTAHLGMAGTAALAAANGGVEAASRALAAELGPRRVNAVSPGVVDTDWWDWLPTEAREGALAQTAAALPVGRIGRPEDVAHAIAFLVENTYTTGISLIVDGGARLQRG